jgi:acyl-CoA synthetase (AMP-forming)/AMP-acid ligase II
MHETLLHLIEALQHRDTGRGLLFYESFEDKPRLLSYPAMHREIGRYAGFFRKEGITEGARVILPFETSERAIISFFALIATGAIPLSVKPSTLGTPSEAYESFLSTICSRLSASWILEHRENRSLTPALRVIRPPETEDPSAQDHARFLYPTRDDLAFVQFSSGSTAFPKGVPICHRKLMNNLDRIAEVAEQSNVYSEASSWLPLYHDMGLVGGLLGALRLDLALHLSKPMCFVRDPLGWLRLLSQARVECSVIPNFAIDYLLRYLRSEPDAVRGLDLSRLELIYLGSEPIHIANKEEFEERLAPAGFKRTVLRPCYGMAESVLMVTCTPPKKPARTLQTAAGTRAISVGVPVPGCTLRLRTEDGRLCADGELGEIEIKSECLSDRYFESDQPFYNSDGYYQSGDIGFVQDGELYIMGRSSERLKINAQNYFASELEHSIELLPFIPCGRTSVIAADQQIVVLAEVGLREILKDPLRYKSEISLKLLNDFGIKIPTGQIIFIKRNQLERTTSGKLRRVAIAQRYAEGKLELAAPIE